MSARPVVDVDVDKAGSSVSGRFTLKNLPTLDVAEAAKPLYAYVGALDLALERAKEVPAQVRAIPAQAKGLRSDVETRVEQVTDSEIEERKALASCAWASTTSAASDVRSWLGATRAQAARGTPRWRAR